MYKHVGRGGSYLVPVLLHATLGPRRKGLTILELARIRKQLAGLTDLGDLCPAVAGVSHLL